MSARLTDREKLLRSITERQFQSQVEGIMRAYGWRYYHAPDNKPITARSGKRYVQNVRAGFPDLVAVRGSRLIVAELKREKGSTSPEQDAWLADLDAAGVEAYVWRPSDVDVIQRVLAR